MTDKNARQKKILYVLICVGLVWMYASYIPFFMDYYVMRPEESFSYFYQYNVVNEIYGFETKLLALMLLITYCVTQNAGVSISMMSIFLFVLSHASYIKYINRKELFRLDDLRLTEAAGMATNYLKFHPDEYLGFWVGGLLVFTVLAIGLEIVRKKWMDGEKNIRRPDKRTVIRIAAGMGVAVVLVFVTVRYSEGFFAGQADVSLVDGNGLVQEHDNQFVLYSFVKNDNVKTMTAENVAESYEFFAEKGTLREADEAVRPNVIVVMNESWWNTDNLDGAKISISRDPMEPYKNMPEECVKGYLTSNVYGGGTVSSEADFLTGINTKYCVGDAFVYAKTLDRKLPSLVDYFNALEYETVAIHPYYGHFYDRETVYRNMGFDKAFFDEDMTYRDIYTRYISDESLVKQIIDEYESGDGNKFIWGISIANHKTVLEYDVAGAEEYDFPISVELAEETLDEQEKEALVSYVNGIYNAGKSYEMLIEYFSQKEEPVVVVMFGDHIPNFSQETLTAVGLDMEADSQEMLEKLYSVPVVMWSNYETEEIEAPAGENIQYLSELLIDYANLPDSEMTQILRCQRQVFKTNVRSFVTNEEGDKVEQYTEEQVQMVNHSKSVAYDLMFGESVGQDVWLPVKK